MLVIIWLNGAFGAGKTTLAEELRRRIPEAVVYNPEDVGLMLWEWMPPNEDFQDLPSWRELVVATALSLRRHHADTLSSRCRLSATPTGPRSSAAWPTRARRSCTCSLRRTPACSGSGSSPARPSPGNQSANQSGLEWAMIRVNATIAAAARQPEGTLMLRSDRLTTAELADEVMAAAGLRQVRCDGRRALAIQLATAREGSLTSTVTIEIMDAKQAREGPAVAFDRSVWRVVGVPLARAQLRPA